MKRILYVLHSGQTGGTFLINEDLMKNVVNDYEIYLLGAEYNSFVLYSYSDRKLNLIKRYPRHLKVNVDCDDSSRDGDWSAKEFHNSWLTFIYFDILVNYNIDLIHIRHLINHSFDLPYVAKKLGIPVVLSMHDFYFLCPFYILLDENDNCCWGECSQSSRNCHAPMPILEEINSKEFIPEWRLEVLKMFSNVDYFVTTSDIVKNLFLSIYKEPEIINENNFKVIEHGRDFPELSEEYFEIPSQSSPIKILCPANHLNVMKGSELIKSIKKEDKNGLLEFHFLGNCHDNIEECGIAHGTFERDDFYKKVKEIQPSFVGIFSIWPETFCNTLTEAWSCGIPVIGSNIGVIEDRILKNDGGWIIDKDNPKAAYSSILEISKDRDSYLSVANNLKKMNFKSTLEMSKEYVEIYESLIQD